MGDKSHTTFRHISVRCDMLFSCLSFQFRALVFYKMCRVGCWRTSNKVLRGIFGSEQSNRTLGKLHNEELHSFLGRLIKRGRNGWDV
jgi:hypothetical protein